jgi:cell pole-organizing protein PopZ
MSQSAKVQEPSMEEILASIRRIIADDDAGKSSPKPEVPKPVVVASAPPPASPPPAPVKAVTPPSAGNSQEAVDAMLADLEGGPKAAPMPEIPPAPPAPPSPPKVTPPPPAPDVFDLTEAMAAPPPPVPPKPVPAPSFRTIDASSDVIFTDRAPEPPNRAVDEARRQFAESNPDRTLMSNVTAAAVDSAFNSLANTVLGQNARTLEDLVKEMLRPMLKSWLDDNLPSLVERIVRAEIERVSRGRV